MNGCFVCALGLAPKTLQSSKDTSLAALGLALERPVLFFGSKLVGARVSSWSAMGRSSKVASTVVPRRCDVAVIVVFVFVFVIIVIVIAIVFIILLIDVSTTDSRCRSSSSDGASRTGFFLFLFSVV